MHSGLFKTHVFLVYVLGTTPNHVSLICTCPIKSIESCTSILPIWNIGHFKCGNILNSHREVWRVLTNVIMAYGIKFLRSFVIAYSKREAYSSYLKGTKVWAADLTFILRQRVDGHVCFHPFIALLVEAR